MLNAVVVVDVVVLKTTNAAADRTRILVVVTGTRDVSDILDTFWKIPLLFCNDASLVDARIIHKGYVANKQQEDQ